MMNEDFVVDVLHFTLNQICDNISSDSCRIIEKIFNNLHLINDVSVNKALCSAKLLLNLCNKIHLTNPDIDCVFLAEKTLQGIKYLLKKNIVDNSIESELLSIISILCQMKVTDKTANFTELLQVFYNDIFSEIFATFNQKDFNLGQMMVMLKILCTLYGSKFFGKDIKGGNVTKGIFQMNRKKNLNDECLLFAYLALHDNQNIAMHTSLFLVPEFIKCSKTSEPLRHILAEALRENCHNHSKVFLLLCNFFSVDLFINEMNLAEFLVRDVNYWKLIQFGVASRDVMIRKQAMYLFKKTIEVLSKKEKGSEEVTETLNMISNSDENFNRDWDPSRSQQLIKIYSDIIIILEYLNEEQVHIVRPIFELIETLVEKITRDDGNNFSWILTIYRIVLLHESTEVIKWGIKSLLKVPEKVFLDEAAVEKTARLLSSTLTNINLYYNNGLEISEALACFFENISQLRSGQFFFKIFIKEVCKSTWSPEALFFVTRSFSELRGELSFWGPDEIEEIRIFVSKAFTTHNKIIRNGIQCEILNASIALTRNSNLPLDTFMMFLSQFSTREIFRSGYRTWTDVSIYLETFYTKEQAEKTLNLFLDSFRHNERTAALSIALFHRIYRDDFPSKIFSHLLSSFKNSHQRPYRDAIALDRYLSVVRHVAEECLVECDQYQKLISMLFNDFQDIINYIHSRIAELSTPKHFSSGLLYVETFETLMKLLNVNNDRFNFENLFTRLLKSLETELCLKPVMSWMQLHFGMRLIKIMYESCSHKLEAVCLARYVLQNLNELLKKEEKWKDWHTIWGKMNSEFLEAKWVILEKLIDNGEIEVISFESNQTNCIYWKDLMKKCMEGLEVGGYGASRAITEVLARIVPEMKDAGELETVVDSVWNSILERRKTDDFKFCVESFVKMLFQEKVFSKGEDILQIVLKYVDLMFSDSSLVTVHTLMKHAEKLQVSDDSISVLCQVLGKGMLFGPVERKDDKLTAQVCSYVESFKNCPLGETLNSRKIRARATIKVVSIRNKNGVSKRVVDVLLGMENDITKKKKRYFGNSFVHRVKTRLMQGLLVLVDSLEKEERNKIGQWLYLSLMTEASQASVRHLQEWSLSLLCEFYGFCLDFFRDSVKKTPKGWCSLITVTYLLAQASLCEIDEAIREILPFSMDQHFETRLYAEVAIMKLYSLAQQLGLREVLDKWRLVHDCVQKSIRRAEGNAAKNYFKLEKHFFFNGFNVRSHHSLETIYYHLPRLTNISSDEWIPPALYNSIRISGNFNLPLNLFNEDEFFQRLRNTEWLIGKSEESTMTANTFENYQKKMIPMKPLMPGWSDCDQCVNDSHEKEGLVVVASLIDRIPNLGGLARTCEVFGASQLVMNTTKCLEDKDFKSVSVTAEKWIRVKEVKAECLMEFIVEMKENGFRVVGAEQAVHSEPLTSTKFPRRCLLLLGNEKTGIPPNIIPLLDVCVEIPQMGIIRSLNVHVTGALFLWEYAKQNLFSPTDD